MKDDCERTWFPEHSVWRRTYRFHVILSLFSRVAHPRAVVGDRHRVHRFDRKCGESWRAVNGKKLRKKSHVWILMWKHVTVDNSATEIGCWSQTSGSWDGNRTGEETHTGNVRGIPRRASFPSRNRVLSNDMVKRFFLVQAIFTFLFFIWDSFNFFQILKKIFAVESCVIFLFHTIDCSRTGTEFLLLESCIIFLSQTLSIILKIALNFYCWNVYYFLFQTLPVTLKRLLLVHALSDIIVNFIKNFVRTIFTHVVDFPKQSILVSKTKAGV